MSRQTGTRREITYTIGIPLNPQLQDRLSRMAFGIKNALWHPPSFYHISLQRLGHLDDATVIDIANMLNSLHHPPFFLTLRGLKLYPRDRAATTIGTAIDPSVDLEHLNRSIETQLREMEIPQKKKSLPPHISLGSLPPGNAIDAEMHCFEYSQWVYTPFLINSLALFSVQATEKNIFYNIIKEFPLRNNPKN